MSDNDDANGSDSYSNPLKSNDMSALLEEFKVATQKCKQTLGDSAESYEQLLMKYTALEKTVAAREVDDRTIVELDDSRNYVLVLIDAHSHNFDGDFVNKAVMGGVAAAATLREDVAQHLKKCLPELAECCVIARAYANFEDLVGEGVTADVTISNKLRTLELFAAGFSSSRAGVDFTNVADRDVAQGKVECLFDWHIKDPQCQHIFFGACGREEYYKILLGCSKFLEKVTIIQGSSVDPVLEGLGLRSVAFPSLIRSDGQNYDQQETSIEANKKQCSPQMPQTGGSGGYFENNRYIMHAPQKQDKKSLNTS